MGRKKIIITPLENEKQRNITFNKRKNGLLKKAAEISLLCKTKLFLAFTDLNGNLVNFFTPDSDFLNEFDCTKEDKKIITFSASDYPDFFKVNHYKKRSVENNFGRKKPQIRYHQNFSFLKKYKYNQKPPLPAQNNISEFLLEDEKEKIFQESAATSPKKTNFKKQLTIKIPEKNKCLEFEMNVLKKVNSITNKDFQDSRHEKDQNQLTSFQNIQNNLTSLEATNNFKEEIASQLDFDEKKNMFSKYHEENPFLRVILSNNKQRYNLENSIANHNFYNPLANLPSKEVFNFEEGNLLDQGFKELNSKNFQPDFSLHSRPLNFNDFIQLFAINNSGGDDYLKFLNLNSSRMFGGNKFGLGNLPSQGMNLSNMNNVVKEEISKEEEGDVIKKKKKVE